MAALLQQMKFWPTKLTVPMRTHITDKRVVRLYNISRLVAWCTAVFVFIFVFKGYLTPATIDLGVNAFMWEPSSAQVDKWKSETPPAHCSNKAYDYYYADGWDYKNIFCKMLPSSSIFSKGEVPGYYFISTLHQEDEQEFCDTKLANCTQAGVRLKKRDYFFPERIKQRKITFQFNAKIEEQGYNSLETEVYPPVYIQMPNGSVVQLPHTTDPYDISWTIEEFMSFFDDVSLDDTNPNAGTSESVGKAHHRLVGLAFYVDFIVSNMPSYFGALPAEKFFTLKLRLEKGWQRVTLPAVPSQFGGQRLIDKYGLRIIISKMPSQVMKFDFAAAFSSCVQVVVFFQVMKIMVMNIVFTYFGDSSVRWRRSVNVHIDEHVMLHRENQVRIKRKKYARRSAEIILGKLVVKLQRKKSKNGKNEFNTSAAAQAIFDELKLDKDGNCSTEDIEITLQKHGVKYSKAEMDALVDVLDGDGSGEVDFQELQQSISKATAIISGLYDNGADEDDEVIREESGDSEIMVEKYTIF